jgi:hypothetical protein
MEGYIGDLFLGISSDRMRDKPSFGQKMYIDGGICPK